MIMDIITTCQHLIDINYHLGVLNQNQPNDHKPLQIENDDPLIYLVALERNNQIPYLGIQL